MDSLVKIHGQLPRILLENSLHCNVILNHFGASLQIQRKFQDISAKADGSLQIYCITCTLRRLKYIHAQLCAVANWQVLQDQPCVLGTVNHSSIVIPVREMLY